MPRKDLQELLELHQIDVVLLQQANPAVILVDVWTVFAMAIMGSLADRTHPKLPPSLDTPSLVGSKFRVGRGLKTTNA